tara:strand:+ start:2750 stop:2938 length:189 start_codon:yes stop_codon:yes gene_type:complete
MIYTLTISTKNIENGKTVTTTETHQSNSKTDLQQIARGKWWADSRISLTNDATCIFYETKGY